MSDNTVVCWSALIRPHIGDYFPALNEFSTHTVIRPQVHHGRTKRALQSTLDASDGLHAPQLTLQYTHQGQRIQIELQRNDRLLPDAHFLRYQNASNREDGAAGYVVRNFTKTDVDLCHYQGHIRGQPDSSVALSTCHGGLNGVVFDGQHTYFIHPHSEASGRLQEDHYLLRHADMLQQNATCGYDSHKDNYENWPGENLEEDGLEQPTVPQRLDGGEFQRMLRRKRRQTDESQLIRGPYNANKYSSYVELVIVVDNKVYKHFGENAKRVHQHCKDLANIVNALYVPLNIFVALVGVVIWNESNEIEFSSDGDVTLHNFLNYRRSKLVVDHPNDNAQLLTKETFNGSVVGKALKGPICTYVFSGGVSVQHSQVLAVVATTMAHEMGHNFGMEHDSNDCHCPDEKCVMASSSSAVVPVHWSSCSIDQLTIAFSRGMNYCLRNKPTRLFDSPQCGNGFVEPGEQCDCGLPAHCENSCCNPVTCMLHTNASCATGECCDLNTCRPKMAGSTCRPAENECDLPEFCTGESEYCPTDVFRRDTEPCDGNQAYCFLGTCRSHTNQCRILWGPTGDNSVHCYEKNLEGTRLGNCGYNLRNQTFVKCEPQHIHCGMLHCNHLNERLEFGMESAAVLSHSFVRLDRKIVACRTALVDLGLQTTDPGLTPNGAKCGDQSMCVNQQCLPLDRVRQMGMGGRCPEDCNGNGICNSRGHCHCDVGFGGEACNKVGHGGSVDSGPATDPSSALSLQRLLYILFFAVLPILVSFYLFYRFAIRNKLFASGKLTENMYVSSSTSSSNSSRSSSSSTSSSSKRNSSSSSSKGCAAVSYCSTASSPTANCTTSAPPPTPIEPMHVNTSLPPLPPAPPLNHTQTTNTATITNIHATLPRLKSSPGILAAVHPPAMPKSQSHYEALHAPHLRRKLSNAAVASASSVAAATVPPPVPPHKNNNNNNDGNSNSNSNTMRRKLDITAPRLHATTNPLALTEGAQYIKSEPASLKSASGHKQPSTRSNQNGAGPPAGGANGLPKSTPSSTDDMNSALLKSPSDSSDAAAAGNATSMFGKFKGFTLRPLNSASSPASNYSGPNVAFVQPTVQQDSNGVPQRAAPPPPVVKPLAEQGATKAASTLPRAAPALPPPNPGSTARPIISKPKLDSSTLTMVPLKGGDGDLSPTRSAPAPPVPLHTDPKLNIKRDGTIRRFASFLKKEEKPPLKEKTYIDRERLRTLEISAPMPAAVPLPLQAESSNSDSETTPREEETKNLVKRTQSMRSPTKKTQVQTFGSMRSPPGAARPKSSVNTANSTGTRPKSPPPRPPPVAKKTNSTTLSGYQLPVATAQTTAENNYDDCEFVESPMRASSDAIYSVIDEIPPAAQTLKHSDLVAGLASAGGGDDMGLLGEIVNEFEKLNGGDSIYSGKVSAATAAASTTALDPPVDEPEAPRSPQRPAPPRPAGSNRNSSSTSAEEKPAVTPTYLRAPPINAPVARVAPTRSDISPSRAFSSFKPAPANAANGSSSSSSSKTNSNSSGSNASSRTAAAQPARISGGARPKSFTKTAKALPNGVSAAPSATIQKPKPLSAKPSLSGELPKRLAGAASAATAAAPTPPTVKASTNIASLTQRFEQRK
ncbi:hypothetical protein AWZ03_006140 [Drosophila navojoa]|uniref:Peptidase M12B domain-containing protein n=1 Tax=Drosophila navojoa TaxID=7232 RepID=A0A484BGM8_DRONA|nr:hypothetical protein AWZ03_006140 [Drosophila navojoa]